MIGNLEFGVWVPLLTMKNWAINSRNPSMLLNLFYVVIVNNIDKKSSI